MSCLRNGNWMLCSRSGGDTNGRLTLRWSRILGLFFFSFLSNILFLPQGIAFILSPLNCKFSKLVFKFSLKKMTWNRPELQFLHLCQHLEIRRLVRRLRLDVGKRAQGLFHIAHVWAAQQCWDALKWGAFRRAWGLGLRGVVFRGEQPRSFQTPAKESISSHKHDF